MAFQSVPKASDAISPLSSVPLPILILRPINTLSPSSPSPTPASPVLMPWAGYGTYRLGQKHARSATFSALRSDHRHIDMSFVYGSQITEIEVGKAIADTLKHGIMKNREEIFGTTKQWREYHGYDAGLKCLELSLERLGLDYVDCWIMDWPGPCWESKERQAKEWDIQTGKRALEDDQDDLWSRAKSGMGKGKIAPLKSRDVACHGRRLQIRQGSFHDIMDKEVDKHPAQMIEIINSMLSECRVILGMDVDAKPIELMGFCPLSVSLFCCCISSYSSPSHRASFFGHFAFLLVARDGCYGWWIMIIIKLISASKWPIVLQ
jgi:hypothetical protein